MYRTPEELENEDVRLWTETIYQSASVFKGAPHEVRRQIQERETKCAGSLVGQVESETCPSLTFDTLLTVTEETATPCGQQSPRRS